MILVFSLCMVCFVKQFKCNVFRNVYFIYIVKVIDLILKIKKKNTIFCTMYQYCYRPHLDQKTSSVNCLEMCVMQPHIITFMELCAARGSNFDGRGEGIGVHIRFNSTYLCSLLSGLNIFCEGL